MKMLLKSLSQVRQVSAGSNHTVLLTADGHVLTCGSNHVSHHFVLLRHNQTPMTDDYCILSVINVKNCRFIKTFEARRSVEAAVAVQLTVIFHNAVDLVGVCVWYRKVNLVVW